VNKIYFIIFLLFLGRAYAQEATTTKDEAKQERKLEREQRRLERALDPLSPSRASFLSAAVPGLGQFYNRKYWKVPLAWATVGTGVFVYQFNQTEYLRYRTAFKLRSAGFSTDEFYDVNLDGIGPDVSDRALEEAQKKAQSQRDSSLLIAIGLYLLNVLDASVDAHLKPFNMNEDLNVSIQPILRQHPVQMGAEIGLNLTITL
jgi:TM2 domain-containing membrane protein YozV